MTERLVTVPLIHGGRLTIPCPEWCSGHDPHAEYPEDVRHETDDVDLLVAAGGREYDVLAYGLVQAPYSQRSPLPYATLLLGEHGFIAMSPDEIRALADGLEQHATALRGFAAEVERIVAQASQEMRPQGMPADLPWPPEQDGDE